MDNQQSTQQSEQLVPLQPVQVQKKPPVKLVIIGALLLGIFLLFGILMFSREKSGQNKQKLSPQSAGKSGFDQDNEPTGVKAMGEPIDIVEDITANIKAGTINNAVSYFYLDDRYGYTKDQVRKLLAADKAALSDSEGYRPLISRSNIETSSTNSQILVEYPVNGRVTTARYDLERKNGRWLVVKVTYNAKLNLSSITNAESLKNSMETTTPYSEAPVTRTLPNGDIIVIKKTLLHSGTDEDVVFTTNSPKESYLVVVYDNGTPILLDYINSGENGANSEHSFSTSDLEEHGGGLLALYPQGKSIDRSKVGVADGTILLIPLKITN